jgi:hypothetical protein
MPDPDSFQTVALYENKDIMAVLTNIHALGRVSANVPGYTGPTFGVKLSSANKRHFDEETLAMAKNTPTLIGKGSIGCASQAGTIDHSKNIVKTGHVQGIEGLGMSSEATAMGKGSHGCATAAGNIDYSKNIDKNAHVRGGFATPSSEPSAMGKGSIGCASQAGGTGFGKREVNHVGKIAGVEGLGMEGMALFNQGSVGLASQSGMGQMHGKREIVHTTYQVSHGALAEAA